MTLYLVRHADAKSRSRWEGPDIERTLTHKGARQAAGLVDALAGASLSVLHSSPAVRCIDTVEPLAKACAAKVVATDVLLEGADPRGAMSLLVERISHPGDAVLCTHGDLIPELLRRLAKQGVRLHGGDHWAKGSTWELTVDGGKVVAGRYHLPPGERD